MVDRKVLGVPVFGRTKICFDFFNQPTPSIRNLLVEIYLEYKLITGLFVSRPGGKGISRGALYIEPIDWREKCIKAGTIKSFPSR
jgi:hypothetical protein